MLARKSPFSQRIVEFYYVQMYFLSSGIHQLFDIFHFQWFCTPFLLHSCCSLLLRILIFPLHITSFFLFILNESLTLNYATSIRYGLNTNRSEYIFSCQLHIALNLSILLCLAFFLQVVLYDSSKTPIECKFLKKDEVI